MLLKLFALIFTVSIAQNTERRYPYNAQCSIDWTLPANCATSRDRIRNQMIAWRENELKAKACPGTSRKCPKLPCGQKCRYVFQKIGEKGKIIGYHLTPKYSYRDNIQFEFKETVGDTCKVQGFSKSTISYAYFDFGTNYCNLRNLLDGAGLSKGNEFQEYTNTTICTQYDKLNCDRF